MKLPRRKFLHLAAGAAALPAASRSARAQAKRGEVVPRHLALRKNWKSPRRRRSWLRCRKFIVAADDAV